MSEKLHEGLTVGNSKLLHFLGSGESGEVWSALSNDGTVTVLKVYGGEEDARGKAEYEYGQARRFVHPNILSPTGMTTYGSRPVILLPYCEGRSVDGIAAHFSERRIWQLIVEVGSALESIHSEGYGHFDVKPSNILWDGSKFLLTDFGACTKVSDKPVGDTATDASSYRFDAPELNTHRSVASDIWSFGATVFYLFMGCHVFNGLGGRAQHRESPVPYMRKSMPELSLLVQRCLDYDPAKRPAESEVIGIANRELSRLSDTKPARRQKPAVTEVAKVELSDFWPEQMIETSL